MSVHDNPSKTSLLGTPAQLYLLNLLVGKVDDELLKAVALKGLEPVDVEDPQHLVLPMRLHLNQNIY